MILISEKIVVVISIITTIIFIYILKNNNIEKVKIKALFFMYCNFIINLCGFYWLQNYFRAEHLITFSITIWSVINIIILKKLKLYNQKDGINCLIIIVISILMGYILYTPHYVRQHDSRDFINYQHGGHFGYIGYIFYNNCLPKGSPVEYWCFYNPPLFYIISATLMKIQSFFGVALSGGLENLQIISMIYTVIFDIYVYKILKEVNVKKSIIYLLAFVALSPAMIIMSGSLNNDILSIMLSTMAIYYTIKWYDNDSLKNLIKIALTISLAIMTKISAALIAVAIACVFFTKVIKNKEKLKKYIWNFIIFAIIALPIGLWYPIKNLILYDVPVTYVQSVDFSNGANISEYSIFERFFTISKENLKSINVIMGKPNIDYNIFLSTIKSFIVDEYIEYENNLMMKISINVIFYCTIILFILFIINIVYIVKNYKKIDNNWIYFFVLIFLLSSISYIKFCFDYPFTFTMNFRYIVPTLVSYAVLTGVVCDKNKKLFYSNCLVITLFCVSSMFLFINMV